MANCRGFFLFRTATLPGIRASASDGFGRAVLAHHQLLAGFLLSAGAAGLFLVELGVAAAVGLLTHETSYVGSMRN